MEKDRITVCFGERLRIIVCSGELSSALEKSRLLTVGEDKISGVLGLLAAAELFYAGRRHFIGIIKCTVEHLDYHAIEFMYFP